MSIDADLASADSFIVEKSVSLLHLGHLDLGQVAKDDAHRSKAFYHIEAYLRILVHESLKVG